MRKDVLDQARFVESAAVTREIVGLAEAGLFRRTTRCAATSQSNARAARRSDRRLRHVPELCVGASTLTARTRRRCARAPKPRLAISRRA